MLLVTSVLAALFAGCQQKMAEQPSYETFEPCEFFENGSTAQAPPDGTVARGHLRTDLALYTGRIPPEQGPSADASQPADKAIIPVNAEELLAAEAARFAGTVDEFPLPVTRDFVEHGRNRFMIYCVVCHDALGTGRGKIVERGYTRPPSYHIARLRAAPVGYLFRVISEGYGAMPSYGAQIDARDRWAIVAYVKALQLSQHFPEQELTDPMRKQWKLRETKTAGG